MFDFIGKWTIGEWIGAFIVVCLFLVIFEPEVFEWLGMFDGNKRKK